MNFFELYIDKILALLIMFGGSLLLKITLHFTKQRWSETFSHTTTIFLLPVITYSITSVISGNIALSLGMIGALSIVRFRNPVRSSFELTLYFYSISLGVAASVSLKWLILLIVMTNLILYILVLADIILKKYFNYRLFKISFSEGNSLSTLEIRSSVIFDELANSPDLISYFFIDKEHNYVLSSSDAQKLKNYLANFRNNENIISSNLKI
jgi:hypothetical protein